MNANTRIISGTMMDSRVMTKFLSPHVTICKLSLQRKYMKDVAVHTNNSGMLLFGKSWPALMLWIKFMMKNSRHPKNAIRLTHLRIAIVIWSAFISSCQVMACSTGSPKYPNVWSTVANTETAPIRRINR